MMANMGIIFTEIVGKGPWWEAGAQPTSIPLNVLITFEVIVMGVLEYLGIDGWKKTGSSGFLKYYPFDPLGFGSEGTKYAEVLNARAAMIGFVGFSSQVSRYIFEFYCY